MDKNLKKITDKNLRNNQANEHKFEKTDNNLKKNEPKFEKRDQI